MYRRQEQTEDDATNHRAGSDEDDGSPQIIITKVESNYSRANSSAASTASFSETSQIMAVPELAATSAVSAVVQGLGGFINDFQTLNMEIKRLKASEDVLKDMLASKQLELNNVSEVWCTSQAHLAKKEMLLRAQTEEMVSLKQQEKNIKAQNKEWDSKLSLANVGLQSMFQASANLMKDNLNTTEDDSKNETENDICECDSLISTKELELRSLSSSLPTSSTTSIASVHNATVNIQNGEEKIIKSSGADTGIKLVHLNRAFSLRMENRQKGLREIRANLARKNLHLYNLTELLKKSKLDRQTKEDNKTLIFSRSRIPINDSINQIRTVVNEQTTESDVDARSDGRMMNHSRDYSVSKANGYACICGRCFTGLGNLHRHLGNSDKDKKFSCDVCKKTFLFFSNLSRHMQDHHKRFCPPKTHGCRTCGAVFPSKTEFMKGWKHRDGSCLKTMKKEFPRKVKESPS